MKKKANELMLKRQKLFDDGTCKKVRL